MFPLAFLSTLIFVNHDAASHSLDCAFVDLSHCVSQAVTMSHFCAHGRRTLPNSQSKFEFSPTPMAKKNWKGRKIKKKGLQIAPLPPTCTKQSHFQQRVQIYESWEIITSVCILSTIAYKFWMARLFLEKLLEMNQLKKRPVHQKQRVF
jgi:hypothetical protein